jgi:hypothetical protein
MQRIASENKDQVGEKLEAEWNEYINLCITLVGVGRGIEQ